MLFIGVTGGVGAGKSAVLDYLASRPGTKVLLMDEIAHDLMEPGTACYRELYRLFKDEDIYEGDGHFDRKKLASLIFGDDEKRTALNGIVHPAVKAYVGECFAKEKERGVLSLLVVEAALLIEEGYDKICDELWYIYTTEDNRRSRLKASRGYSDEKVDQIFASQLTEAQFREKCAATIDNNGSVEETRAQIDELLLARDHLLRL